MKLHFINKKACLINCVLKFYLNQILFSIIFWKCFFENDFSDLDYEMNTCFLHSMSLILI